MPLTRESYLTQGHDTFTEAVYIQWLIDVEYKDPVPFLNLDQLWRVIPDPEHSMGYTKTAAVNALQFNFSCCPILFSSVPHRCWCWECVTKDQHLTNIMGFITSLSTFLYNTILFCLFLHVAEKCVKIIVQFVLCSCLDLC